MNKRDAAKIAETITNEQIQEMFNNAKENITDWTVVSSVNKSMSKGAVWNILAKGFNPDVINTPNRSLGVRNMVWEFGDYLPDNIKIRKSIKHKSDAFVYHKDPIF